MVTVQEMVDFENRIAEIFNRGEIRAPVHLHDGISQQARWHPYHTKETNET